MNQISSPQTSAPAAPLAASGQAVESCAVRVQIGVITAIRGANVTALPSLAQQEAIIVGDGVTIPMRMRFDDLALERRPASDTAAFSQAWCDENADIAFIDEIVERRRLQKR